MENKVNLQHNKLIHIEDSMVMYGIYNAEISEKLITTIDKIQNITTLNKRLFVSKLSSSFTWYLTEEGVKSLCYKFPSISKNIERKYVKKMYEQFIVQLHTYAKVRRILSKVHLPISLILPSQFQEILNIVKNAIQTTDPDYDIVIKRLHLYYDMKLVTFGIDSDQNLILQLPVLIHPHM